MIIVRISNKIILTTNVYTINKLIKIYFRFVKRFKNVVNQIYEERLKSGVQLNNKYCLRQCVINALILFTLIL